MEVNALDALSIRIMWGINGTPGFNYKLFLNEFIRDQFMKEVKLHLKNNQPMEFKDLLLYSKQKAINLYNEFYDFLLQTNSKKKWMKFLRNFMI